MITRENLPSEVVALKARLLQKGKDKRQIARSVEALIMMTLGNEDFVLSDGDFALANKLMKQETGRGLNVPMVGIPIDNA